MNTPPAILSVGAATLDTIFRLDRLPSGSGKYIPLEAIEVAAGMASSAAMAAARLGARASICACVGDDRQGAQLVADFAAEGIDCRHIRRVPGARSAFSTILVDSTGDRIIVPRYDPGLLADTSSLPLDELRAFDVVMVDVRWPAAGEAILHAARTQGVTTLLDVDVAAPDIHRRLVPLASHCVFSEPAALAFTSAATPADALAILARNHPSAFMAITVGADGCLWWDAPSGTVRHLAAPGIVAVDTLAAGDVFHGAFAVGLAQEWSVPAIVRFANGAAALKCTRFGGRLGAPTRAEVEAFLLENGQAFNPLSSS